MACVTTLYRGGLGGLPHWNLDPDSDTISGQNSQSKHMYTYSMKVAAY